MTSWEEDGGSNGFSGVVEGISLSFDLFTVLRREKPRSNGCLCYLCTFQRKSTSQKRNGSGILRNTMEQGGGSSVRCSEAQR